MGRAADDDAEALLAAIVADPDDLAARSVFADRLVAAGDPRGEFIHIQCKLAAADAPADPPPGKVVMTARDALRAREAALLKKHKAAWLAPLKSIVKRATFARGFPEIVEIDAAKLVAHGATLARTTPIASLAIGNVTAALAPKVAACALLSTTPDVSFVGAKLGAKAAEQLLSSARFTRARSLSFAGNYLDEAAQAALGRALASAAATLRVLDLDDTGFQDASALTASGLRLTHLALGRNPLVSGIVMRELGPSALLAGVRDLNLYDCNLQTSVCALADGAQAMALERLVIHRNKIPTAAARTLLDAADAGRFPKLAEVWIHDNAIAKTVAAAFAKRYPRRGAA